MAWRYLGSLLTALAVLTGCGSTTTPVPPCCYQGAVAVTRLEALSVRTTEGRRLTFVQAFPGFMPQDGLFTRPLPFEEARGEDIIYASLEPLLPIYDANGDGRLERPEILVLYAREAARGTGTPVAAFLAGDTEAWAVAAPNADVGGLVTWTRERLPGMSPEAQAVFRDLERLGIDLRTRGSEGGGDEPGVFVF
jgi:hypothetical protein